MNSTLLVSAQSLVDRLFQFSDVKRPQYKKFINEMVEGILGSRSSIVANIARFVMGDKSLRHTEKRLCRNLNNEKIPWDELHLRVLEIGAQQVGKDDVIAFDPGDLCKKYAKKMEHLYPVWDGSKKAVSQGYEEFSVEAITWKRGKKFHIPLYQKLINADVDDYISQNRQITDAIRTIQDYLGDYHGIWTFDRGHDRARIIEDCLLPLPLRWMMRVYENRSVIPLNPEYESIYQYNPGLMDMAMDIPLTKATSRLVFPKKTASTVFLGWEKIMLPNDPRRKILTLLVIHDKRNAEPVILLTTLEINSMNEALVVFGYYLERWGKEEGYRFCKSFLNLEDVRMLNWEGIKNLAFLVFLTYQFVALFYRGAREKIERLAHQRLKHFKPIETVRFQYYRVAHLMRILLWEQKGVPIERIAMTEVG
jgi:hypothetical protein